MMRLFVVPQANSAVDTAGSCFREIAWKRCG